MDNIIHKEGREPREDVKVPAHGAGGHHLSHSAAGVSGTGSIASVSVEFPLLIVLIQRFEECDQRCDVAGGERDALKLHGAIAQPACSDLT